VGRRRLGKFEGELQSLSFTARESVSSLAECKVTEPEFVHGVEDTVEFRDGSEMSFGIGDRKL
jgi:hypothetical protein